MAAFVFWLSLGIFLYTYIGYPLLLRFVAPRRPVDPTGTEQPAVTVLIAACNEAAVITAKLENTFALDYPADRLHVAVVADGSTDATVELVQRFPAVQLLYEPERRGKSAALNRGVAQLTTPLVVVTDANTFLPPTALRALLQPFAHPQVGGVAGAKRVIGGADAATAGEGLYWRYESQLKALESRFYSTIGAAGELFAFRRACFREIPATAITDDFFLSLSINLQGYTIAYAPEAVATEAASLSLRDEWNRKVRIAAGGFQSLAWFRSALHPFRHPRLALQFFSHRVLRWVACAPALVLLFTSNLVLFLYTDSWFYSWAFGAQSVFYGAALAGFLLARTSRPVPFFFQLPFYFVLMHAALPVGWWRFVRGKQSAIWQKAQRSVAL